MAKNEEKIGVIFFTPSPKFAPKFSHPPKNLPKYFHNPRKLTPPPTEDVKKTNPLTCQESGVKMLNYVLRLILPILMESVFLNSEMHGVT